MTSNPTIKIINGCSDHSESAGGMNRKEAVNELFNIARKVFIVPSPDGASFFCHLDRELADDS